MSDLRGFRQNLLRGFREVVDEGRARFGPLGENLLRDTERQFRTNPAGFIPPHAQQAMANTAQALEFTDAGDVKAYQDTTSAALDAVARGSWADAAMNAPGALASLGALLMPGVSARMLQDAPTMVRGMADSIGGAYPGNPSERGMFAGIGAKNADMNALNEAMKLEQAGEFPSDIWEKTGWGRGADNKWRFEIDDSQSALARMTNEVTMKKRGVLGKSLIHDQVYEAYPDTADIKYMPDYAGYASGRKGTYKHDENTIAVNVFGGGGNRALRQAAKEQQRSTTLHELQHAIQAREGFGSGGNAGEFTRGYLNLVKDASEQIEEINKRLASAAGTPKYDQLMQERQILVNQIQSIEGSHGIGAQEKGFEDYRRLAGEVEARNVQTRMNMTSAERRERPPWFTQDVPNSEQIVRFKR